MNSPERATAGTPLLDRRVRLGGAPVAVAQENVMKTREEMARFVEHQFDMFGKYECQLPKGGCHHYGKQEVRELMDFIYGGEPQTDEQKINGMKLRNGHRA